MLFSTDSLALTIAVLASVAMCGICRAGEADIEPTVTAFEDVYTFASPGNGSGPLWSYGCTSIARVGDDVLVSEMETGEGVPLLCNTRWRLRLRGDGDWKVVAEAEGYRQREPTSFGVLSDGSLYLYVNDSTEPPGVKYGLCEPHLLRFVLPKSEEMMNPKKLSPTWAGEAYFTDHSYRGYGADGTNDELLMLNIHAKTGVQHWAWLDASGKTLQNGLIEFPIRSCYSPVALKDRTGHVVAVGDIVEPVEEWREFKFAQTERKWDYVFRILYYTWTPDIASQPFSEPIEITNVDKTSGHIFHQELWISPEGDAYVVYTQQDVHHAFMRDKYFPDLSVQPSLHLAIVRKGEVVARHVLIDKGEGPGCARFHETPDGRAYLFGYAGGPEPHNYLMPVYPDVKPEARVRVPFEKPFTSFATATVRAGNKPSNTIDTLGNAPAGDTMSYGQVTLR
ncbi:MAG: hypothetical protein GY851_23175 [bacterium]|nr:hypothetical protein [bacterium]